MFSVHWCIDSATWCTVFEVPIFEPFMLVFPSAVGALDDHFSSCGDSEDVGFGWGFHLVSSGELFVGEVLRLARVLSSVSKREFI
mgnify:CR=1 FL=1